MPNDASVDYSAYLKKPFLTRVLPYLIIAPALLITIGILYPFVSAIYYSLTNYSFIRETYRVIWGRNWFNMFSDPTFWHAAWVTTKYAFWSAGMEMLLGLGLGLLICKKTNIFTSTLRVVLVFPLMIAPVIATLIWQLMTNTSVGIIEKFLNLFGIYGFAWASAHNTALFTAVLIDVWVNTPFIIVLVVAGINSLPKSPFEAAQVDGASAWFTFKNLTLPMLKPFLYIALIFRLMAALQEYAIIFALTKGGPGDTLMNLSLTAYNKGFYYKRFGEAMPYILFLWLIIYIIAKVLVGKWLTVQRTASGR
ncbi:MAG: sugar ABC transporter permease [Planctomycetota bacterium]|nr:sugar ABC transporter permease [Planctomycetota bacterium]